MRRNELQRMLDEASDQAATQAAAIVVHQLRPALKAALKEMFREWRIEFIEYLLTEKWIRLIAAILFALSVIGLYWKEHT